MLGPLIQLGSSFQDRVMTYLAPTSKRRWLAGACAAVCIVPVLFKIKVFVGLSASQQVREGEFTASRVISS